ncbi:MAG: translation initiation factor 1A [Halobacteriales archaeon]|jgi:translation initiation factor 1A
MPDENELFVVGTDMQGYGRVELRCADGEERMRRIPGRMRKRVWIREDDVVIVDPWDWEDSKADLVWRFGKGDADQLRDEGHVV